MKSSALVFTAGSLFISHFLSNYENLLLVLGQIIEFYLMIYNSTTTAVLTVPVEMCSDLCDLLIAYVAEREPYNLRDLQQDMLPGVDLYRSCATYHNGRLRSTNR